MKLCRDNYIGDPFYIAQNVLLGSNLVTNFDGQYTSGRITEVEVYIGGEDKASHTYGYKKTKRVECQYKIGGHAYIFFVYGLHSQFCVVVGEENVPNVVLIRSIEPIAGIEIMQKRRGIDEITPKLSAGPGNVCKCLGITKDLNGIDLCQNEELYIEHSEYKGTVISASRVGIDYAEEYKEKLWRFYFQENKFVTHKKVFSRKACK